MSIRVFPVIFLFFQFFSMGCKEKENISDEPFFPVVSFLKSQIAQVDTTLNTIRKLTLTDSSHIDTVFIHRNEFSTQAVDFLSIPDISSPQLRSRYTEEKVFDEMLNRVLISYLPLHPEKEVIQRQEVLIKPDPSGDKVTNIIVNTVVNTKDSAVQKKMLWIVDESFQVITTKQVAGQPETVTSYKVLWNENQP